MSASPFAAASDLVPHGILLLGALLCIGIAAFRRRTAPAVYTAVSAAALAAAAVTALLYLRGMPATRAAEPGYVAYGGGLVVDRYTVFLIPAFCALAMLTLLSAHALRDRLRLHAGELHAFTLVTVLAAALLAGARDMVTFWVALELLSVTLYVLVAVLKTRREGSEAAFKQLVLGVAGSAFVLYGLALLYGLSGTTDLVAVSHAVTHTTAASALAMALVVVGMTVKLGIVPFHQWVPDVTQAAPGPVAALVAGLARTAAFAVLARVVVTAFPASRSSWMALVALLSAATMAYGAVAALAQRSVRRMIALTAVAQAGFVLMGLIAYLPAQQGIAAMLFALVTEGVTVIGLLAAVTVVEADLGGGDLDDYRGLARRSPAAAAVLVLGMASLVGVPPLVGFFAKILLLQTVVLAGYAWLMVVALVAAVLGLALTVRIAGALVVDEGDEEERPAAGTGATVQVVLAVCGLAIVFLGAAVQPLFSLATGGAGAITVR